MPHLEEHIGLRFDSFLLAHFPLLLQKHLFENLVWPLSHRCIFNMLGILRLAVEIAPFLHSPRYEFFSAFRNLQTIEDVWTEPLYS